MGNIYGAGSPLAGFSVSTAIELVQFAGIATATAKLLEIRIAQSTIEGDSLAEMVPISWFRTTALGAGGTVMTGTPTEDPGAAAAKHTAVKHNTAVSTSLTLIGSDAFNLQAGFLWVPTPKTQITVPAVAAEGVVFQIGSPAAATQFHVSVVWEEHGIT